MADVGHVMGAQIETDMRRDLSHLPAKCFSFYSDTKIGQLMSRMTSDLFDVTEFAHHCPEEFYCRSENWGIRTLGYWPALISG